MHYPSAFDSATFKYATFGIGMECSDITGTGRPVLYVQGKDEFSLVGMTAFYILGDALDEKVDMYFDHYLGGGDGDTCTLDGDKYGDMAFGYSWAKNGGLSEDEGALLFVHGSPKIPVRLNRDVVRRNNEELEGKVTVSPNPFSRHSVVTWESSCSGSVHVRLLNILGQTVFEEDRPTTGDLEAFSLDVPALSNGLYILQLIQEPCTQEMKIVIKN